METFYNIYIGNYCASLPIMTLSNGINIAFFNLHGNPILTEECARLLAEKIMGCDVIITAESKGLQLAHCIARNLGHKFYAVARKSKKLYMQDGLEVLISSSITTGSEQKLYLSAHDANLLKGKKVAIVDDVISTGNSLEGLESIVNKAGGDITHRAFVLAEGNAKDRDDIIFLNSLPLFN